jgi:ferredoxin-NADP reductase
VLLISAGIGVTPVLAMLHQLAAARSTRDVWWIHGARSPREHPLAAEAHTLLASLPHAREHVFYSVTAGRLSKDKLLALDVPTDASAYICGPASFMTDMRDASARLASTRPASTPSCSARCPRSIPVSPGGPPGRRTSRRGPRERGRW